MPLTQDILDLRKLIIFIINKGNIQSTKLISFG